MKSLYIVEGGSLMPRGKKSFLPAKDRRKVARNGRKFSQMIKEEFDKSAPNEGAFIARAALMGLSKGDARLVWAIYFGPLPPPKALR